MLADLPINPDLDKLRGDAKTLRDLVRARVDGAIALVAANHPRLGRLGESPDAAAAFKLADAQLTLARHYGFASWPRMVEHVNIVRDLARRPHELPADASPDTDERRANEFLRLACLNFGADSPEHAVRARAMLDAEPAIARHDPWTMAATGEHALLAASLSGDTGAANRRGGPFDWPPLLYLTYSRVVTGRTTEDAVAAARALLDAGADVNAGYLWDGNFPPFTALTGVIGKGEQNASPHARWEELTRLLLDCGADANDGQAVYNIGLGCIATDDTAVVELLLGHGLGRPSTGPWYRNFANRLHSPELLVAELLHHAALHDLTGRASLLLARGVDPNRGGAHPLLGGVSPYVAAVRHGSTGVVALLRAAGAEIEPIAPTDEFLGACMAGDADTAHRLAAEHAGLVDAARRQRPSAIADAAAHDRPPAAVELLASFGFDVNHCWHATALHEAAFRGNEELVGTLLRLGADPTARDPSFDGTPAGWAAHRGFRELAARLADAESSHR